MGIGDWGLGIGDWAQSPIPKYLLFIILSIYFINIYFDKIIWIINFTFLFYLYIY